MRSSSSGTTMARTNRTIPTEHTTTISGHLLRAVWGSDGDRRSVGAFWWWGKVSEKRGPSAGLKPEKRAGSSELPPSSVRAGAVRGQLQTAVKVRGGHRKQRSTLSKLKTALSWNAASNKTPGKYFPQKTLTRFSVIT